MPVWQRLRRSRNLIYIEFTATRREFTFYSRYIRSTAKNAHCVGQLDISVGISMCSSTSKCFSMCHWGFQRRQLQCPTKMFQYAEEKPRIAGQMHIEHGRLLSLLTLDIILKEFLSGVSSQNWKMRRKLVSLHVIEYCIVPKREICLTRLIR